MKKEILSKHQATIILILIVMSEFLMTYGSVFAGKDTWFALLVTIVVSFFLFLIYVFILSSNPEMNVFQIIDKYFGKIVGKFLIILFCGYGILIATVTLYKVVRFISVLSFPATPLYYLFLIITLFCFVIMRCGIEDFIGNDAVWMPDVTGAYYTSRDVETYKNGATNKTQLSYYMNITVSSSWRGIQALGWDDNNPFICLPSKLGSASSTTYFGTNIYGPNGSNEYLSRNKFYSGYSANCNLLSPIFDYQFSNTSSTTTSRLIKYEI